MSEYTLSPDNGFVVAHHLTVADVDRAAEFYVRIFDAEVQRRGTPTILKLANTWVILNVGGGPTDDKPEVHLVTPPDPGKASSFLNIRVADIFACYSSWRERGGRFLSDPKDHGREIRCYMRDPDGYLIEVGQLLSPKEQRE